MRAPMSWLREHADLPAGVDGRALAGRLIAAGLEVETVDRPGHDVAGPVVVGRVLSFEEETHSNGKTVRWCTVEVGGGEPRGIVCGALNFAVGDSVVVGLLHQVVGVPEAVQTGLLGEAGEFEQFVPWAFVRREDRELHRRTVPVLHRRSSGTRHPSGERPHG